MPCPITLTLQYSQVGARAWIAHSKLSKVCESPPDTVTEKALSYSLPQTSHWAMFPLLYRISFSRIIPSLQDRNPPKNRLPQAGHDVGVEIYPASGEMCSANVAHTAFSEVRMRAAPFLKQLNNA